MNKAIVSSVAQVPARMRDQQFNNRLCELHMALKPVDQLRISNYLPWATFTPREDLRSGRKFRHIRSRGGGMNPSAIWRILSTEYGVRISKETVWTMMIAEKTWHPRPFSKPESK